MKRTFSIYLVASLALCAFSVRAAQHEDPAKQGSAHLEKSSKKAITISGMVGSDGKTLVSDKDKRIWTVANPNALSASEGRRVTVKAYLNANLSEINVALVRLKEEKTKAKLDDAAFRR